MFFALNQKFENRCYNIEVSGIPSGILHKLIKRYSYMWRYDILACEDVILEKWFFIGVWSKHFRIFFGRLRQSSVIVLKNIFKHSKINFLSLLIYHLVGANFKQIKWLWLRDFFQEMSPDCFPLIFGRATRERVGSMTLKSLSWMLFEFNGLKQIIISSKLWKDS